MTMQLNSHLPLFLDLYKFHLSLTKKFECHLDGLGLTDFVILYHLYHDQDDRMRRVDLARKMGLSPSAVTRQLLSMEKIGLVGRKANQNDARSTFVTLKAGGRRKFEESMGRVNLFCDEVFGGLKPEDLKGFERVVRALM